MRIQLTTLLLVTFILMGCTADDATLRSTIEAEVALAVEATVEALPTATAVFTQTPYPTFTAVPTQTPFPTQTPLPTYTPFPTSTPIPATPTETATATATATNTAVPVTLPPASTSTPSTDARTEFMQFITTAIANIEPVKSELSGGNPNTERNFEINCQPIVTAYNRSISTLNNIPLSPAELPEAEARYRQGMNMVIATLEPLSTGCRERLGTEEETAPITLTGATNLRNEINNGGLNELNRLLNDLRNLG